MDLLAQMSGEAPASSEVRRSASTLKERERAERRERKERKERKSEESSGPSVETVLSQISSLAHTVMGLSEKSAAAEAAVVGLAETKESLGKLVVRVNRLDKERADALKAAATMGQRVAELEFANKVGSGPPMVMLAPRY